MSDHIPVLLKESIECLAPKAGGVYIDGTFGAGGHSRAILSAAPCKVIALDRDPSSQLYATKLKEEFGNHFTFILGNFRSMTQLLAQENIYRVHGILLDIGVSSMQLDQKERGFSFQEDGPLDMRMEQKGLDAAEVINHYSEEAIADILYHYGDERYARRIAYAICQFRAHTPIQRTRQLRDIIHEVIPRRHNDRIDPATRSFQALRIYINQEIEALKEGIEAALSLLEYQGRLVIITFHSGEDALVKEWFKRYGEPPSQPSRYLPSLEHTPLAFKLVQRKAIKPSEEEIRHNPRARSAKLRTIERIIPIKEAV